MRMAIDGLVLREMQSGDNDRRILVLTSEGKMWMTAKGAKSVRSKYANFLKQRRLFFPAYAQSD